MQQSDRAAEGVPFRFNRQQLGYNMTVGPIISHIPSYKYIPFYKENTKEILERFQAPNFKYLNHLLEGNQDRALTCNFFRS